uniref:Uncharacterized protein n=1 Tax=Cynoglossus semilaevis TaxID=244447 RepID=A0A3P8X3J4_CYNSE
MNSKSLQSRLFNRTAAAGSVETHRYQRHEDCVDSSDGDSQTAAEGSSRQEDKYQRDIHFVFLPGKYEPLVDEEAKEEKKKRKKLKYKKVKKNVRKALRSTWKCLKLGLYNFALGYSTPITVAATFVPDFHRGRTGT